jgi:hypothetical protein
MTSSVGRDLPPSFFGRTKAMRLHHVSLAVFTVVLWIAGRVFADPPTDADIRAAASKGLVILKKGAAGYLAQKKMLLVPPSGPARARDDDCSNTRHRR